MTKVREGYKETEIGVVPEEWEVVNLQAVGKVKSSKRVYQSDYVEKGIPFFRSKEIIELSKNQNPSVELYIENDKYTEFKEKFGVPEKKDLLITSVGTIGKVWISDGRDFYYKDGNLTQFTSNGKVDIEFVKHLFNSDVLVKQYMGQSYGSAQVALTIEKLNKFLIPFPSVDEQNRIAEILSTTDAHIEKLEKTIEDYQLLKKGMMKKLLTEGIGHTEFKETEIGRIPMAWKVVELESVADKVKDNSFIDGDWIEKEHIKESGIRLIQTGNIGIGRFVEKEDKKFISEESFEMLNCKEVLPNDILICRMAEPTGRSCIIPKLNKKMITSVDCVMLRVNEEHFDNRFINYYLNSEISLKYSLINQQGTTRKRITRKKLAKLNVPVPSINEQKQIADILRVIDSRIELFSSEGNDFKQLKKYLMEKLLTGKIRTIK